MQLRTLFPPVFLGVEGVSIILFFLLSIYISGFLTAVAVFRKPKAIPLCFSTDLVFFFSCHFKIIWVAHVKVVMPTLNYAP